MRIRYFQPICELREKYKEMVHLCNINFSSKQIKNYENELEYARSTLEMYGYTLDDEEEIEQAYRALLYLSISNFATNYEPVKNVYTNHTLHRPENDVYLNIFKKYLVVITMVAGDGQFKKYPSIQKFWDKKIAMCKYYIGKFSTKNSWPKNVPEIIVSSRPD